MIVMYVCLLNAWITWFAPIVTNLLEQYIRSSVSKSHCYPVTWGNMHCISLAILTRLSLFPPPPAVGTNCPFCVGVPLNNQSINRLFVYSNTCCLEQTAQLAKLQTCSVFSSFVNRRLICSLRKFRPADTHTHTHTHTHIYIYIYIYISMSWPSWQQITPP